MENDQPNSAAGVTQGKRKREHVFVQSCEDDLNAKDHNLKVSRQSWQKQAQQGSHIVRMDNNCTKQGSYTTNQGYHNHQQYPQPAPLVVTDNWNPMMQLQQGSAIDYMAAAAAVTPNVPALNMKQKSMAAAMLRDLRSSISDPSKLFLQCQLQQQEVKYGMQQLPCSDPITQLPPATRSQLNLQREYNSPNQQSAQSPLKLPITSSSQIYAAANELDFRNASPTSSSSSPYPNLQNSTVNLHNCNNAGAVQLPEVESVNQNGAMIRHGSPNPFLQQGSHMSLKTIPPPPPPPPPQQQQQQQRSVHSSSNVVLLQQPSSSSVHNVQSSLQLPSNGHYAQAANGTAVLQQHPPSHTSQRVVHQQSASANHALQNGSQNVLLQNGSQNGMRNGMWSSLQNGMMMQQQQPQGNVKCLQQNGVIQQQQQSGQYSTQHLPGHLSQSGIQNRPTPQQEALNSASGNNVTLRESSPLVMMPDLGGSWHPSLVCEQASCITYTESSQQANGSSKTMRSQIMLDRPPSATSGSSLPEFGTQTASAAAGGGVPMSPGQELGYCQGIHRNGDDTERQSSKPQFEMQNNNNPSLLPAAGSITKSCSGLQVAASRLSSKPVQSLQSEVHGRRLVQGSYCSSSSSGAEPPPPPPAFMNTSNSNEGLDHHNPSLQGPGGPSCTPKLVRSFTKVYKLGSITRAINVNQFSKYAELRCALARMFNLDGQLDQELGWKLVFLDNENDLLLVGDDPWEVFVSTVRAIRILSPAEVSFCMSLNEEESGVCL